MSELHTIGDTAGKVYKFLKQHGASSLSAVERGVDVPNRTVYMAVGWLAREGKVAFVQDKRTVRIELSE